MKDSDGEQLQVQLLPFWELPFSFWFDSYHNPEDERRAIMQGK